MQIWIVFVWQGFLALFTLMTAEAYKDETDLRANLSSRYNTFVRPDSPTNVSIYHNIRSLQQLDITEQRITITSWMTLFWNDPRFIWDSSTNGIVQMEINWGWRPEFVISNSAEGFHNVGMKNDETRLRIYNTGFVRWNPPLESKTSCEVDISKFPFDTQTCDIEVIWWGFSNEEVQLINLYPEVQKDVYLENAEWLFDGSKTSIESVPLCCPLTYGPIFRVSFTFSRRRPFYVMNLIFPTVLLSVCMIWVFMLPTESGERLGYSLTILLAYTVQLSITAQLMPTTSKQVPHIARYLLVVLVLCSVVTCNVVVHVKLFYLTDPVYGWLKKVYRKVHPLVMFKCCSRKKTRHTENKIDKINIDGEDKTDISFRNKVFSDEKVTLDGAGNEADLEEVTWAMVSVLMDRICFYAYVIGMTIVNAVFLDSIS